MAHLENGVYVDDAIVATPSRADYLNGKCSHEEFYCAVLKTAGIKLSADHPLVERARESHDSHYNDMGLAIWDSYAPMFKLGLSHALKAHGDSWSLAGNTCALKTAARLAIEAEGKETK